MPPRGLTRNDPTNRSSALFKRAIMREKRRKRKKKKEKMTENLVRFGYIWVGECQKIGWTWPITEEISDDRGSSGRLPSNPLFFSFFRIILLNLPLFFRHPFIVLRVPLFYPSRSIALYLYYVFYSRNKKKKKSLECW